MENENARRKIRTKLFNNLVDDGDDDVNMSATVHQIVELCAWRGERAYRPHDHNNLNEEEIDALINIYVRIEPVGCMLIICTLYD